MPEYIPKKGDFVKLRKYEESNGKPIEREWKSLGENYGVYHDVRYVVIQEKDVSKGIHHPIIQSTDPKRPITFEMHKNNTVYPQSIDWEIRNMELDEDYIKEKLKQLFG